MARPTVDWDRDLFYIDADNFTQSVSESFVISMENLIGENQSAALRMIEVATMVFASNVISIRKGGSLPAREHRAAADRLMKDCQSLAIKLANGCGGLYLQLQTSGIETKKLSEELNKLSTICRDLRAQGFVDGKTIKQERVFLARWVKFVLENEVGIKTSTYVNEDEGRSNIFHQVLMLCIDEAIHFVPTSIKHDLLEAKHKPLPPHDNDFWVDLSEEEIKEIEAKTSNLFS